MHHCHCLSVSRAPNNTTGGLWVWVWGGWPELTSGMQNQSECSRSEPRPMGNSLVWPTKARALPCRSKHQNKRHAGSVREQCKEFVIWRGEGIGFSVASNVRQDAESRGEYFDWTHTQENTPNTLVPLSSWWSAVEDSPVALVWTGSETLGVWTSLMDELCWSSTSRCIGSRRGVIGKQQLVSLCAGTIYTFTLNAVLYPLPPTDSSPRSHAKLHLLTRDRFNLWPLSEGEGRAEQDEDGDRYPQGHGGERPQIEKMDFSLVYRRWQTL